MADSITFDSTDLSGASYGLTVLRAPFIFSPPPEISLNTAPFRDGAIAQDTYYQPLTITVRCSVDGSTFSDLKSKVDAVRGVLNERGDKSIKFDFWNDRYWLGRLATAPVIEWIGATSAEFDLSFLCADPFAYSTTQSTPSLTIATDPDDLSLTGGSTVGGTEVADPVWKIFNNTGGPVSWVALENEARGERLLYNTTLADQDYLKIDVPNWTVSVSSDDSDYAASMAAVSGQFPRLSVGDNTITVHGVSTGTLSATYRARYM